MHPVSRLRADAIACMLVSWQTRSCLMCSKLDQSAFLYEETLAYLQLGVLAVDAAFISAMVQYTHTSATQGNSLLQAFTHITTSRFQSFLH